jgi:hypothetical protein
MLEPLIKLNNEVDAGELDRWLDLSTNTSPNACGILGRQFCRTTLGTMYVVKQQERFLHK